MAGRKNKRQLCVSMELLKLNESASNSIHENKHIQFSGTTEINKTL